MKLLLLSFFSVLMPTLSAAVSPCAVSVVPQAEITGDVLKLSDLVKSTDCPELLPAAAEVHLGSIPLPGSVRVFEDTEIAARLRRIAERTNHVLALEVPARIRVRQAGERWSCSQMTGRFSQAATDGATCGAAGRIAEKAVLEITREKWDWAANRWDLVVRCQTPSDCVPFLIQLPEISGAASVRLERNRQAAKTGSSSDQKSDVDRRRNCAPLVHRGEQVILIWDQDGIRLRVPSISMEEGRLGKTVRVRTMRGGTVFRAIVEGAGTLRVK